MNDFQGEGEGLTKQTMATSDKIRKEKTSYQQTVTLSVKAD